MFEPSWSLKSESEMIKNEIEIENELNEKWKWDNKEWMWEWEQSSLYNLCVHLNISWDWFEEEQWLCWNTVALIFKFIDDTLGRDNGHDLKQTSS